MFASTSRLSLVAVRTVNEAVRSFASPLQLFQPCVTMRSFVTRTIPLCMPLEEFRDPVPKQKRMVERVGRSWSVYELRRKSYEDLHKLWIVLYKERNMLLTEQQLSRRLKIIFPQPERLRKVQKSMGAIKQVLGERKRSHLANLAEAKKNAKEEKESTSTLVEDQDDVVVVNESEKR